MDAVEARLKGTVLLTGELGDMRAQDAGVCGRLGLEVVHHCDVAGIRQEDVHRAGQHRSLHPGIACCDQQVVDATPTGIEPAA